MRGAPRAPPCIASANAPSLGAEVWFRATWNRATPECQSLAIMCNSSSSYCANRRRRRPLARGHRCRPIIPCNPGLLEDSHRYVTRQIAAALNRVHGNILIANFAGPRGACPPALSPAGRASAAGNRRSSQTRRGLPKEVGGSPPASLPTLCGVSAPLLTLEVPPVQAAGARAPPISLAGQIGRAHV